MAEKWTEEMVEDRFREAAATMKRLPDVSVQGFVSSWPPIIREFWEAYGWDVPKIRLGPPTGESIDRMDECLEWIRWLEPEQMRLVWARAEGLPWKIILRRIGVSRATAWQRMDKALAKVAARLNAQSGSRCLNKSV